MIMAKKDNVIAFIKGWGAIGFVGLTLFLYLLMTNGRLGELLYKLPLVPQIHTELRDVLYKPYIF